MAEAFTLSASISLDISGFMQGLNNAVNSANHANHSFENIGDAVSDAQKDIDKAADAMKVFGTNVSNLESPFTTLKNKLDITHEATRAAQEQVDYLTQNFNDYAKTAGAASDETASLYDALQKAEHQLAQCQAAEQAAQEALDAYNASMNESGDSTDSTARSNDELAKATESAGQSAESAGTSFSKFSEIISSVGDLSVKVAETVANATIGIAAAIEGATVGAATALTAGVSSLAQYGDQIDKQSQKIGISAEKYQEWDAVLRHSGTSVGVLQAGMRTLRSAMDSLGNSTREAVVDQEKLTAAQTAYDNAVLSADKALLDYNSAIEKYGEESDQAISKLIALEKAQNSVESAQAKVKKAMEGSTPKMSDAAAALNRLGISATDAAGNLRDEEEVFSEVITALQNMENETEKQRYATILLGRGGTELGALLNTTAEDTQKMKDRVHELNGVLSDESVKAAARFQDSLQDMTTGFTGLKNKLLQDFLPVFADVMDGVTDIFAGDSDGGKNKIEAGLESITKTIESSLPKVMEIGEKFLELGDKLAPAVFKTFDVISNSIIKSIENINIDSMMDTLMNALSGASDVVGRFAGSLADLIVNGLDNLANSGGIERIVDILSDMIDSSITKLTEVLPKLSASVATIFEKLMQAIPKVLTGDGASGLIGSLIDSAITIVEAVVNNINPVVDAITTAFPKIVDAIARNVEPVVTALGSMLVTLVDSITQDEGVLDSLVDGISTIISSIVDNIDPILIALESVVTSLTESLLKPEVISKITESLAKVLGEAIVGAAKVLGSMTGYLFQLNETMAETLKAVDWKGIIVEGLAGIGAGIIEALGITEEFELGVQEIENFMVEFCENWENGYNTIKEGVDLIKQWFGDLFSIFEKGGEGFFEDIEKFKDAIASIPEKIVETVSNAKQWGTDLVRNFTDGLKDNALVKGVESVAQGVKDFLGFSEPKKGPLSDFHTYAPDMIDLFVSGIKSSQNRIDKALEDAFTIPENESQYMIKRGFAPESSGILPDVAANKSSTTGAGTTAGNSVVINYTQNNTSPQALDEYEIWRQNQRAMDMTKSALMGW